MNFYCLKQSLACPVNLIGKPDCENCQYYGDCQYCARKNTRICEKCEVKENEIARDREP